MPRHTRARLIAVAAALAASFASAAPAVAVPAPAVAASAAATAADAGPPLDITPNWRTVPRQTRIIAAGPTGYAHETEDWEHPFGGSELYWTDFATGRSSSLGYGYASYANSGTGTRFTHSEQWGDHTLRDLATGAERHFTLPRDASYAGLLGATLLIRQYASEEDHGTTKGYYLLTAEDPTAPQVPVSGWPEDADLAGARLVAGDDTVAVLRSYRSGGSYGSYTDLGVVDLRTGRMTALPAPTAYTQNLFAPVAVSPDRIAWVDRDRTVHLRDRAALDGAERTFPLPEGLSNQRIGLVGDWVLALGEVRSTNDSLKRRLVALAPDGRSRTLLDAADADIVQIDGGGASVVGGTSATDWYVRTVTPGGDGAAPGLRKERKVDPMSVEVDALALGSGVLSTVERGGPQGAGFYRRTLGAGPAPAGQSEPVWAGREEGRSYDYTPCGQSICKTLLSSGEGRAVYQVRNYETSKPQVEIVGRRAPGPADRALTGNFDGRLVDSFGRYAVYQGGTPTVPGLLVPGDKTVVVDLQAPTPAQAVVQERPQTAAAVWGSTLYTGTDTVGQAELTDLPTGRKLGTVATGATCQAVEFQAVGRWLYWACSYFGQQGVVDLESGRTIPLPSGSGNGGLLGDGFYVDNRYTDLRVVDFHSGTAASRNLGLDNFSGTRRGTWTVDRFGGGIAYRDRENVIHVLPSGVPTSAVSVAASSTPAAFTAGDGWKASWALSKPVSSWRLEITHKATGAVVRTLAGGEARGTLDALWDAKDTAGRLTANGAYRWTLTAQPADGGGAGLRHTGDVLLNGAAPADHGTYKPLTPTRLMDTRSGTGVPKAKVGAGKTVSLKVAGAGGVPATGVTAVVLNVTATNPTAGGFVSVYPSGTQRTSASNLNFVAGQTVPNLVVVPVVDGTVMFYNHAGTVDLLADVAGYYTGTGTGTTFRPVAPARLMDTRSGTGVPKAKVGAGGSVTLAVPERDATAVVLNVTATNPTAGGFVSVYPSGTRRTSASNLNFVAGQTVSNQVVVPVADGKVTFYNHAGTVDLLADVTGYFLPGARGSEYRPLTPTRLMDTRSGTGVPKAKVGAGKTVSLKVAGAGGVPATGVTAVVLNVTATNPTAGGFVSVYPSGTERSAASSLNFAAGRTVPNLVVVPVVDGKVMFYNHAGTVDLLADVAGYYAG